MVRLDLYIYSSYINFRTIDNVTTGNNPEDRVQKLETQVTDLKKTVADQENRIEEMEKLNPKKAIEDLTKRIQELESWPGTSEDALMKFLQDSSNDAEGKSSTKGPSDPAGEAEPSTED
ncbi:hypothetical protein BGAL_0010g00420 [Botrytis galanthina]|uniref:Uncharacterized protein n=1 Tax=Botrytis galanthina TaxID=278940 RepID=A0A4S8RB19_9HELO|nr:hypothetical protein BGAL_0010g00420 [Botrytis galanthina]